MDDGSQPPLEEIVERFSESLNTRYIRVRNNGPAAARNHGVRAAKGRYLIFTDHDCVPVEGWLSALRDGFALNPEGMLGGPKENGLPNNLCSEAHQIASNFAEQWFREAAGAEGYFTTNNLAVPREALLRIGGFSESIAFAGEDRELGARWSDHGLIRLWCPKAVVLHRNPLTLGGFLRQHFRYGAGAVEYRAARRRNTVHRRFRFEGVRFHFGLVAWPLTHSRGVRALQLAGLLLSAQAGYLAGFVIRAVTARGRPGAPGGSNGRAC